MSEWQPIETAPKDKAVLVGGGEYFMSDETFPEYRPFKSVTIAAWNDFRECWLGDQLSHDEFAHHKPTHWMPLPEPPPVQASTPKEKA